MKAHRIKLTKAAIATLIKNHPEQIHAACEAKYHMTNRYGRPQHRRISVARQVKKMAIREGAAT